MSEQAQTTSGSEAGAPPAEGLALLTGLMRHGRKSDAERQVAKLAARGNGGGHAAVLASVIAEPQLHGALDQLEQWLDGTVDPPSATPLGAWWALPAAGLDLPAVASDAGLYINAYPKEGLVIGNLQERASDWLVRRIALSFDASAQLPGMRAAIAMLAGAARPAFPATSASLDRVVTDVDDATLWGSLVNQIVRAEIERTHWP